MITTDPETGQPVDDFANEETPGAAPPGGVQPSPADAFSPDDHALLAVLSQAPHPGETTGGPDPLIEDFVPGGQGAPHEQPAQTSTSAAVSSSFKGITPAGKKQAGGIFGATEAKANARNASIEAEYAGHKARLDQGYADTKVAMEAETAANKEHLDELTHIHQAQYDFAKTQADLEAMAQSEAKAKGEQYLSAYKQDMVGVRQLMMQSGNPLGGLDATGGLGLAAAAFTQGFLGARGINVNVTGQIDKWVDREMAHHQQAIENQKGMAQSQLTLYGIARQGAQDDWEARQRLRGFVIDGMKSQVMMEADRWGSQMAVAEAKRKAAELDIHQTSNDIILRDKVIAQEHQSLRDGIAEASAISTASIQSADLALRRKTEERLQRAQDHKDVEPLHLVADPTNTRVDQFGKPLLGDDGKPVLGGKYTWAYDTSLGKEVTGQTVKKVTDTKAAYTEINQSLASLRDLYEKAKPYMKGPDMYRNVHPEYRKYEAEKGNIVSSIVRAYSGLAASDQERKTFADRIQPDKLFQEGGNTELIDQFNADLRNHYNTTMQSMVGSGLRWLTPISRKRMATRQLHRLTRAAPQGTVSVPALTHPWIPPRTRLSNPRLWTPNMPPCYPT